MPLRHFNFLTCTFQNKNELGSGVMRGVGGDGFGVVGLEHSGIYSSVKVLEKEM